jgi:hypothetical protein
MSLTLLQPLPAPDPRLFPSLCEPLEETAARRRWRIKAGASATHDFDPAAPGRVRLTAELVRRRDGPPGAWALEQDDETGRLRVVAGLAGHGLDETDRRLGAAASAAA